MTSTTGNGVWTNADGLRVRFGTEQSRLAVVGSPMQAGVDLVMEADLDYADFPAYGTERFLERIPVNALPAGALIKSAQIVTTTAFTSDGSATLTLGISKQDGTTIDADGIDAAIALTAIDTVGETVNCDGAIIGTKLAYDSYLSVTVGTADFTNGKARLVITYFMPAA